jgi:hyperosmotically inducible periplasmic protein
MPIAQASVFVEVFFNKKLIGGTSMKTKLLLATVGAAVFALAGCSESTTNTNVRTNVNTNLGTNGANSNVYVVNSNANTSSVTNGRWTNANVNRADYDKNRAEYERDKRSGETIGQGANDSWLWTKTRLALMTTNDLRESTIDVDVVNDVVTLKGTVENAAQKAKAVQVAKGIEGVKSVTDQLKVAANDSMTNTGGNTSNANRSSNANAKK